MSSNLLGRPDVAPHLTFNNLRERIGSYGWDLLHEALHLRLQSRLREPYWARRQKVYAYKVVDELLVKYVRTVRGYTDADDIVDAMIAGRWIERISSHLYTYLDVEKTDTILTEEVTLAEHEGLDDLAGSPREVIWVARGLLMTAAELDELKDRRRRVKNSPLHLY